MKLMRQNTANLESAQIIKEESAEERSYYNE